MRSAEVMATIWSAPNGSRTLTGKRDRKSTRLNSSHGYISYAVFCLKKKNNALNTYASAQCTVRRRRGHDKLSKTHHLLYLCCVGNCADYRADFIAVQTLMSSLAIPA